MLGLTLGAALLVGGAIGGCSVRDEIVRRAFMASCESECVNGGADAAVCTNYCGCGHDLFVKSGRLSELESLGDNPPADHPVLLEMTEHCGRELFVVSCVKECAAQPEDTTMCTDYCGCTFDFGKSQGRLREFGLAESKPAEFAKMQADALVHCGDEIYDVAFKRNFMKECSGPECATQAECFLRELRGTGPRDESTRFLVENLDVTPPTAEGEARLNAATVVCVGGAAAAGTDAANQLIDAAKAQGDANSTP
jgi:hypothetical protein